MDLGGEEEEPDEGLLLVRLLHITHLLVLFLVNLLLCHSAQHKPLHKDQLSLVLSLVVIPLQFLNRIDNKDNTHNNIHHQDNIDNPLQLDHLIRHLTKPNNHVTPLHNHKYHVDHKHHNNPFFNLPNLCLLLLLHV